MFGPVLSKMFSTSSDVQPNGKLFNQREFSEELQRMRKEILEKNKNKRINYPNMSI